MTQRQFTKIFIIMIVVISMAPSCKNDPGEDDPLTPISEVNQAYQRCLRNILI